MGPQKKEVPTSPPPAGCCGTNGVQGTVGYSGASGYSGIPDMGGYNLTFTNSSAGPATSYSLTSVNTMI